jgi:curved DNA-binding protein CbpA
MKNYYDILAIKSTSTQDEIKQAYRKLSLKLHPDKNESDRFFDEMFKNINEAYSILGDPSKRKSYDKILENENLTIDSIAQEITEFDGLCVDAIILFLIHKQATASLIQRKLKIGYNRAEIIINQLNELGLIGDFNGGKQREILFDKQGIINLLTKKVTNFSKSEFLEKYNLYQGFSTTSSTTENIDNTVKPKHVSIWDGIKQWRKIAKVFWILNLCLIIYIVTPHKKVLSFFSKKSEIKEISNSKENGDTIDKLIGCWFYPHSASINIKFEKNKTFIFNDYNSKLGKEEVLLGSWKLNDKKLILFYNDRPKQIFAFYKGDNDDRNYYIKKTGYYFVKSEDCE